jgi:retinol dehydrogenase-12
MTDRTFLVTGANTGIGRATALALARLGGTVVLAARSEDKARPVIEDIKREAGHDRIHFLALDLGDLASVAASADTLLARREPLHVLVNNAGVAGQRGVTKDGFELAFGTNHLGHFLFTRRLLDRLRESAPARVVNLSSDAHFSPKAIDWDACRQPTRTLTGLREYGVSKLANVLFTQELARRLDPAEVTAAVLHPGVIASDIWRRVPWPFRQVMTWRMKSVEDGARTSVYCATSPDLDGVSGRYFEDCRERTANTAATPELARELWDKSEEWTVRMGAPGAAGA